MSRRRHRLANRLREFLRPSTDGFVIFSLFSTTDEPVAELSEYFDPPPRPRAGDRAAYEFGHASFTEKDPARRAAELHRVASSAIAVAEDSGIRRLPSGNDIDTTAFFTLCRGPHTISADVLRRLAALDATIWVDP